MNLVKRIKNLWRLSEIVIPIEDIETYNTNKKFDLISSQKPLQMGQVIKRKKPSDKFLEK